MVTQRAGFCPGGKNSERVFVREGICPDTGLRLYPHIFPQKMLVVQKIVWSLRSLLKLDSFVYNNARGWFLIRINSDNNTLFQNVLCHWNLVHKKVSLRRMWKWPLKEMVIVNQVVCSRSYRAQLKEQISCIKHNEHHLIVLYCEFCISIYARRCPSIAGIQRIYIFI